MRFCTAASRKTFIGAQASLLSSLPSTQGNAGGDLPDASNPNLRTALINDAALTALKAKRLTGIRSFGL